MTPDGTARSYRLTFCRETNGALTSARLHIHATPISITDDSESRVSADVRQLGMAHGDRFQSLEAYDCPRRAMALAAGTRLGPPSDPSLFSPRFRAARLRGDRDAAFEERRRTKHKAKAHDI